MDLKPLIIVAGGGRNLDWSSDLICRVMKDYIFDNNVRKYKVKLLIHGGCRGADKKIDKVAKTMKWPIHTFSADWDKYGKSAGPIRNKQMLEFAINEMKNIDESAILVLAFPGNKGTKSLLDNAYTLRKNNPSVGMNIRIVDVVD